MLTKVPADQSLAALSASLERAEIAHAFSGWIAHGYYTAPPSGQPPHTLWLGLHVFGTPHEEVSLHLDRLGIATQRSGHFGSGAILVVSCADGVEARAAARRIVRVPFGEDTLPIVSPEDLIVDELRNGQPDWERLEQLLFARLGELDTDYLLWALAGLPADDLRRTRFFALARTFAGLDEDDVPSLEKRAG